MSGEELIGDQIPSSTSLLVCTRGTVNGPSVTEIAEQIGVRT